MYLDLHIVEHWVTIIKNFQFLFKNEERKKFSSRMANIHIVNVYDRCQATQNLKKKTAIPICDTEIASNLQHLVRFPRVMGDTRVLALVKFVGMRRVLKKIAVLQTRCPSRV